MNAFFEILADALKKYAAEILAAVLFSFSLWKFPKLRRLLTKYKGEQLPQDEITRQEKAHANVEAVSASSGYYERARKCERSAERWRRMSELFSKLRYFATLPLTPITSTSITSLIFKSLTLSFIVRWFFPQYEQEYYWYCVGVVCIVFSERPLAKFMSFRSDKALNEAKALYEQGAEHGEPEAMKRTAQLYSEQKKYLKTAYWYEKLAERGDFEAMYSLVDVYSSALDYENSYLWYQVIKLFGKEKEYTYHYDGSSPVRYVPEYQRKQLDIKAQEIFSKIRSEHYARSK